MTTDVQAGLSLVYVDTQASAISQASAYSCKGVVADGVVSTVFPEFANRAINTDGIRLPGSSTLQQWPVGFDVFITCL